MRGRKMAVGLGQCFPSSSFFAFYYRGTHVFIYLISSLFNSLSPRLLTENIR